MSYKNPKKNNNFESYNNGERSHMVSGDALGAIGDSHKKFDSAMEAGKQLGSALRKGVEKYQAMQEGKALDAEWNAKKAEEKKTLDSGGSIQSGGKSYKKVDPSEDE